MLPYPRHSMGKFSTKSITSRQHPYPELQSIAWNAPWKVLLGTIFSKNRFYAVYQLKNNYHLHPLDEPHLRPEFVWLGWQISCNICLKIISSPIYHWWDNACALAKSGHICGNVPAWCPNCMAVLYIQGPPCMAISSTFPIYILTYGGI